MTESCDHESEQHTTLSPSGISHEFICKKCGRKKGCGSPIVPFWLADTGRGGVSLPQIEITQDKEPSKYKEVIVSEGLHHFVKKQVEIGKWEKPEKKKHWWQLNNY